MSINYQGYDVNGLHYQNGMLTRIAMFGGLHSMELAALKTTENILESS